MASEYDIPAFLVAGNASHVGKTTTCLALLCALQKRGFIVRSAKAGPDFIDTRYHSLFSHAPCANLDLWMGGKKGLQKLLTRICRPLAGQRPDILMIEGAMGLFDGADSSSAHLAELFDVPVLLLLSAKGLGESIAAIAEGFFIHARRFHNLAFLGLIVTNVGSDHHRSLLRKALFPICRAFKVPLLGCLPRESAPALSSRHLGLVSVEENRDALSFDDLAAWFEKNCDGTRLLRALHLSQTKNL
ncbi:MAG: cobyrinate a,c-diamide synthase, partial [Desulfovibrio sp.]|nr:cobyrinate a,c-diamide synthase [Desulfovibrio sp.]